MECSCGNVHFAGFPCSHIFAVHTALNTIPDPRYIHPRWLLNAAEHQSDIFRNNGVRLSQFEINILALMNTEGVDESVNLPIQTIWLFRGRPFERAAAS
jgi:hypothetical protein